MANEGFTKLRNGLYMDNRSKKIGKLVSSGKGGWYVDDKWYENERPEKIKTKREDYIKTKAEALKKEYEKTIQKLKEREKYSQTKTEAKDYNKRWNAVNEDKIELEKQIEAYDNPEEAKYVSKIVDYNAKNRVGRYANYNTEDVVAKNKDIENDIKSLYIYKNEKNMGAGEPEPLKRYYDKYGKKDVDSVWKDMDRKYAVIEGTSMDSEGLRYNSLVEKRKYSSEAMEKYRKKTEQAWKNYYGDSKKYNEEVGKAREEFENSNKLTKGDAYQNKNGVVVEIKDIDDKGQTTYSMQSSPTTPPSYYTSRTENDAKRMLELNGYEKVGNTSSIKTAVDDLYSDDPNRYEGTLGMSMKEYNEKMQNFGKAKYSSVKEATEDPNSAINKYIQRKTGKNPAIQETYTKTGNIRYSAFGIERTPEDDFSDDGTRFTAYRLPNGMEMTVAKDSDDIYLSVDHPYNKEVSYEEYSSLPHYKDLDMYNGVRKDSVDLNKVIDASNKYLNEYNELLKKKGIKPEIRTNKELRLDSIKRQIERNEASIKSYNESKDYSLWRYNRQQMNRLMKKNEKLRKELDKLGY